MGGLWHCYFVKFLLQINQCFCPALLRGRWQFGTPSRMHFEGGGNSAHPRCTSSTSIISFHFNALRLTDPPADPLNMRLLRAMDQAHPKGEKSSDL